MAYKDRYGRVYVVVRLDRELFKAVEALRDRGEGRTPKRRTEVMHDLMELGLALKKKASAPSRASVWQ